MRQKWIDQVTLWDKIHKEQSTISKIITASKKKNELNDFHEIAKWLWMSEKEFDLLYISSDKERLWIWESSEEPTPQVAMSTLKKHYWLPDSASDEELATKLLMRKYHQ